MALVRVPPRSSSSHAPVDGLELALLLVPAQSRRRFVGKADGRLDRADLRVGVALGECHVAVSVALALQHVFEPALPLRSAQHVLNDCPDLVEWRLDLGNG